MDICSLEQSLEGDFHFVYISYLTRVGDVLQGLLKAHGAGPYREIPLFSPESLTYMRSANTQAQTLGQERQTGTCSFIMRSRERIANTARFPSIEINLSGKNEWKNKGRNYRNSRSH